MLYRYPVDIDLHILWIFMKPRLADIWISIASLITDSHIFEDILNADEEYPINI